MSKELFDPRKFFNEITFPKDDSFEYAIHLGKRVIDEYKKGLNTYTSTDYIRETLENLGVIQTVIGLMILQYVSCDNHCIDDKLVITCVQIICLKEKDFQHMSKYRCSEAIAHVIDMFYTRISPENIIQLMLRGPSVDCVKLAKFISREIFDDELANKCIENFFQISQINFCKAFDSITAKAAVEMFKVCQQKVVRNDEAKQENS